MAERDTSQAIDDAAANWVAREDRAPLSAADQQALRVWLDGDSRRPGAYLRARAMVMRSRSAGALGPQYDPAYFTVTRPVASRRSVLAWSGAAASVGVAALLGVGLTSPKAHATARGELRLVPLEDGSTVMLNTATRLDVKYDKAGRRIRLTGGEADFSVLADPQRPFIVEAGERRLSVARDSAFRVRKLKGQPLDILVHQGWVTLEGRAEGAPLLLGPNTRLELTSAGDSTRPQAVPPTEVDRELAWRAGKIAFEGETLAQAAQAFARYSDIRILVEDPDLAAEPITGLFAANDPVGFSTAAASVFNAVVERRDRTVVIRRAEPIKVS